MGYRSNVMAIIYPDGGNTFEASAKYEQLKVLMGTTFKDVVDEFGDPYMTWMHKEHALMFSLEDVKWYPSYPDVQLFEKMLAAFDVADDGSDAGISGYCTEFVRVGEENDDVEERHTGDNNQYYLNVRRSIDCNI
jgi:hypothetical protein